ncbi:MAG: hypothetical protein JXA54_14550 [Candidatus Heimdallarchaeota archaeon]|nr:hypothetical protein [Candidatus Heimdallarchaeota archaeon]
MSSLKKFFTRKSEVVGQEILKPVRIDDFSAPTTIPKGKKLEIPVSGNFSNLGWDLAEATAKVHEKQILLSVIGKKKSGMMAAQALKPYHTVIVIKGLKKGEYTIKTEIGTPKTILLKVV